MALDTDSMLQCLSRVRSNLQRLLSARCQIGTIVETKLRKGHRRLRTALLGVITGSLLPEFRIHADDMACLLEDLGTTAATKSSPATGVDVCFGSTLLDRKRAAPQRLRPYNLDGAQVRTDIINFERHAKAFIKSVRALPHESVRKRLDSCEARFDASWQKVAQALREPV